jgi:hypothetical protein
MAYRDHCCSLNVTVNIDGSVTAETTGLKESSLRCYIPQLRSRHSTFDIEMQIDR